MDAAYDRNAASAGYSDCLHDSTSFAEKMESPCAFTGENFFTLSGSSSAHNENVADTSNAESASHGAIGVRAGTTATGNRGSDDFGARQGASMEYAIANNIGNPAARAGFALREDRAHPGSQRKSRTVSAPAILTTGRPSEELAAENAQRTTEGSGPAGDVA